MTHLGSPTADAKSIVQIGRSPRWYRFVLRDGETHLASCKRLCLPNDAAALQHAQQLARGFKWIRWSIFVTDQEGNTIGQIG